MPESLKPAATIYLVFLCCRPLFFFPLKIFSGLCTSHLCFSYRSRMPLCVCAQFVQLSPPSVFLSFLPAPPLSLTHTQTHKPCSLVWGWSYRERTQGKKKSGFKVPIKSRLVGSWLIRAWEGRGQKGLLCRGFPTCLCLKTGHWASSNPADCLASSPVMDLTVISLPPVREEAS